METISRAMQKCSAVCGLYKNILVSISGGADSDIMLDMLLRTTDKDKLHFVFFDTGIEYKATKEHLNYLEKHYDIKIEKVRATKPVPLGCKESGLPFISKFISQMIERLQNKGFDFQNDGNKTFEELCEKYPDTVGALTWWCNKYPAQKNKTSHFNISTTKWLKEYMIEYPPTFKISDKCCKGAKKETSHDYESENKFDLKCVGLRQAEGGIRASANKSCYEYNSKLETQKFRPIWHFTDRDKEIYKEHYKIVYSDCYSLYGMKRTGCAGCPFNSKFEEDIDIVKNHEPQLYKAVNNIFGKSYEYTRQYREYKRRKNEESKQADGQISMFDIGE